jgi:MOSC domain-containing protein YiiM
MRTLAELDTHLDHIRAAPRDHGTVALIVRRPEREARDAVEQAELDPTRGLVGDNWSTRGSKRTPDGSANLDQQLTLMSIRAIAAITEAERYALAGDQLFVDFDLSHASLPAGTRLAIGGAVVEITEVPHTGCDKFSARFGSDATKWVNTGAGRELRLRGVNARIVSGGLVRRGDAIRRA